MLALIPRPYLMAALATLFLVSNGVSFYRGWHTASALAEARHTAELAAAQAEAAQKQKALAGGVQRASEEAYHEQVQTDARLAAADAAVDRLRATVARANGRANTAASAVADAAAARSLVADCSGKYRDVARDADRLRATVIALQAYAREVSK